MRSVSLDEPGLPWRLIKQIFLLFFLASLGLAIWSHWKKDQFPPPEFYDLERLVEPRQTRTLTDHVEDFQITRKANAGWRLVYKLAVGATLVGLLGLTWVLLFAPYRI